MICTLAALYRFRDVPLARALGLLPVIAACVWLASAIQRLSRNVAAAPLDEGIALVKTAAKNVPAWVTVVAWTSFVAVTILFLTSSRLL